MEEQAVDHLEGALLDVLVGAVHRISRLEADDGAPTALLECLPCLQGIKRERRELRRLPAVQQPHRASHVRLRPLVQLADPRVRLVGGAVHKFRLPALLVRVDLGDLEDAVDHIILLADQGHPLTGAQPPGQGRVDRQRDRNRPHQAVGQVHGFEHGVVVLLGHEACQGRERPDADEFQI